MADELKKLIDARGRTKDKLNRFDSFLMKCDKSNRMEVIVRLENIESLLNDKNFLQKLGRKINF